MEKTSGRKIWTHLIKLILWAKLDLNHNNYIGISLFGNVYCVYCDIKRYQKFWVGFT